jgi:hypothetical protein
MALSGIQDHFRGELQCPRRESNHGLHRPGRADSDCQSGTAADGVGESETVTDGRDQNQNQNQKLPNRILALNGYGWWNLSKVDFHEL